MRTAGTLSIDRTAWIARVRAAARQHRVGLLAAGGAVLLLLAYVAVFSVTRDQSLASAVRRALTNVIPATALSLLVFRTLRAAVIPRSVPIQAAAHPALAVVFALAWYVGIMVIYGFREGWVTVGLDMRAFPPIALVWQLFQGVTLYAVVAGFAYAVHFAEEAERLRGLLRDREAEPRPVSPAPAPAMVQGQLLVRTDGEVRPVPLGDVIRISGAGDYAEVVTRDGPLLANSTLAALEEKLPPDAFVRVHRSHIIALDAVLGAEPAGNGRLTIHLPNGDSVTASRAGSRAFRARTI